MFNIEALIKELEFKAIRSSGSGGQHVNKVSSKVELKFDINKSKVFNEEQIQHLKRSLTNRLSKDGILILQCDDYRSQHKNKTLIIQRFLKLIEEGLIVRKPRKKTKIPKAVVQKRLENKRKTSEKKANRKKPNID